jgi:reverse gyrase
MIPVIYGELCPQCGGDLSWFEIERNICKKKNKDLSHDDLIWKYRDFENFFREKIGTRPRAIQRMWARRVLNGMSFAAIAPTGIGKTLFGVVMASYLAEKGKKSYILLPTTLLLKEVVDRLEKLGYENVLLIIMEGVRKRKL